MAQSSEWPEVDGHWQNARAGCKHLDGLTVALSQLEDLAIRDKNIAPELVDALRLAHGNLFDLSFVLYNYMTATGVPPGLALPDVRSTNLARQFFSIPELVELVLLQLPADDVLWAQRALRCFHDVVQSSPRVQRRLGLQASPNDHFSSPFVSAAALCNRFPTEHVTADVSSWVGLYFRIAEHVQQPFETPVPNGPKKLRLTLSFNNKTLPVLGDRCRSMLVCNPPIKEVHAKVQCCEHGFSAEEAASELGLCFSQAEGFTVGKILDITKQLQAAHRNCPFAPPWIHDEHGIVQPGTSFHAVVELREDDPIALAFHQREVLADDEEASAIKHDDRMAPFADAKRNAFMEGRPIPTLQEYESSVADASARAEEEGLSGGPASHE